MEAASCLTRPDSFLWLAAGAEAKRVREDLLVALQDRFRPAAGALGAGQGAGGTAVSQIAVFGDGFADAVMLRRRTACPAETPASRQMAPECLQARVCATGAAQAPSQGAAIMALSVTYWSEESSVGPDPCSVVSRVGRSSIECRPMLE